MLKLSGFLFRRGAAGVLLVLACTLFPGSALAETPWRSLSGPTPPPVSELTSHDGAWFMGTDFADQGDVFISHDEGLSWQNAGLPNGGVSGMLSHQGTLFVGTYLGLLYRTDDMGLTWQPTEGFLPQHGTVEAMIALNDSTVLAGLDPFFPAPIYRSQDGGLNWAPLDGSPNLRCFDLLAHDGVILAGGEDQGVWRSADGGLSWAQTNTGLPADADVHRFAAHGSTLFLAAESVFAPLAVYRSDDGGLSWQVVASDLPPLPGADAGLLTFVDDSLFLGTHGTSGNRGLYRSDDLGASWTLLTGAVPGDPGVRALAVMAGDLVVGANGGAFRSSDGGLSWADSWVGSRGPGGGVTAHWTGQRLLTSNDAQGRQPQGLLWSTDLGDTWNAPAGPAVGGQARAFLQDGDTILAAMYGIPRGVIVSHDGGLTFSEPGSGMGISLVLEDLLAVGPAGSPDILAASTLGLHRSQDQGLSWTLTHEPGWIRSLCLFSGEVFAGLYPGGVLRSADDGATWLPALDGMGSGARVNDLEVFAGQLYAALNSGDIMLWNGSNWVATGYNGPIPNDLLAVDGALLACNASNSVLVSADGQQWSDFSPGLTGGIIEGLAATPGQVVAITRHRGMWIRPRADLPGASSASGDAVPVAGLPVGVAPNPFNPRTRVSFTLEQDAAVTVNIHDAAGHLVRTLVNGPLAAGPHAVAWDGRDRQGGACASGLYLARVVTPRWATTAKMMLVR